MPSNPDSDPAGPNAEASRRTDVEEYWLLRRAFRDAIWDVIGTVLAVILAGVFLFFGIALASQGLLEVGGTTGILMAAVGLVLVAGAVVQFMREFQLFPFD